MRKVEYDLDNMSNDDKMCYLIELGWVINPYEKGEEEGDNPWLTIIVNDDDDEANISLDFFEENNLKNIVDEVLRQAYSH